MPLAENMYQILASQRFIRNSLSITLTIVKQAKPKSPTIGISRNDSPQTVTNVR